MSAFTKDDFVIAKGLGKKSQSMYCSLRRPVQERNRPQDVLAPPTRLLEYSTHTHKTSLAALQMLDADKTKLK